jgi:pimeloyl-ACP methyl ester carboxylesterase
MSTLALHYTIRWASLFFPAWAMRFCPVWHMRTTLVFARWVSQFRRHCRYVVLEEWLPRLAGRPVFVILDGRDTYVLPEVSESLFQYFPQGSSQRWSVRHAKHNMAREVDTEEFDKRLVEFYSQMINRSRLPAGGAKVLRDVIPRSFNDRVSS